MLTLFTTAKAFEGHIGVIQRNALKSWTLLHPGVEVILFGDDAGAAEAARELGIRHVPEVERVAEGPKILRSFFDAAQRMALHDILCYINCDIILTADFVEAVRAVRSAYARFLMVGRRWDTDIAEALPFDRADWASAVRALANQAARCCTGGWIDYFVFPKGLYLDKLPPFVIGRVYWDQWLVWKARASGIPVVDASERVLAIHQTHDYGYHATGREGVWRDELSRRNLALAGGRWHLCTIEDSTHVLGVTGVRPNPKRNSRAVRRFAQKVWETTQLGILDGTRPVRHALGIRKNGEAPESRKDFRVS